MSTCAWPLARAPQHHCGITAHWTVYGLEHPVDVCGNHAQLARKQRLDVMPLEQGSGSRQEHSLPLPTTLTGGG
jgi:hypothetical protein